MNRCSSCGQPQTGTFCLNCNSVITTPDYCRKCNGPYNNCYCCFICGNYPCTCYSPTNNCSYCGSYYCNGECRNVCYYCGSRSCSGSCQSSGGGGGGTTDPEESCGDVKCPTCGKCLNPTKPNCVKCSCCEHTLRCQSPGCGKLIRTNTRVGMNCSHVESDFCPSSGPACECGERHVDSEGNPLCSSAIVKKEMCETKEKAYPIMWTHTVKTNTEIAAAIVNKGMVIIEYNDENSATGCYINVTTCKKTGEKYIRYDGIRERLYHTGHIHTHPFVDTTKIENGSIRAKTLLSMADAGIPAKFGDAYIVYSGLVFQYYDQSFNNNSLCPIIHNF